MRTNLPPEAIAALDAAAEALRCDPAILAAILEVESGGIRDEAARLRARRFEPHVFRRLGGPASASYGGHAAAALADPDLAEEASSHGAPQIMGFHHRMLDYPSARAMRATMIEGGWPEQIAKLRQFAEKNGMASPLRALSINDISRIYNGEAYADRGYHLKLARAYARISGRAPARVLRLGHQGEDVLELQHDLTAAGFAVKLDSVFGPETERAVRQIQRLKGLAADGIVGAKTWAALGKAEAPEAVEPVPTAWDVGINRIGRHRGKWTALLGGLAALREELASWAASLSIDAGALVRSVGAAAAEITFEQWALLGLAVLVLWPHIAPRLRRMF